jgi:hypothetical protein
MESFEVLGQKVSPEIIYPVYIHHADLDLPEDIRISLIDLVDSSCITDPGKPPKLPGSMITTQTGNLLNTGNPNIKMLTNIFNDITDRLLIQRVGNDVFDFLEPTEILCYGTIMGNGFAGTLVRHNYPWMYTATLFLKAPKGINAGDAGLSFIDTRGTSENAEGYILKCIEKHLVVYPSNLCVRDVGFFNGDNNDSRIALNFHIAYNSKKATSSSNTNFEVGKGISEEEFNQMKQSGKIDPDTVISTDNGW